MEAVFFDMDGLLVDSERLWFEVESEVMERLGGDWSAHDQEQLVGGSMERTVAYMLARSGNTRIAPEEVARLLDEGMLSRLHTQVPIMPGAKDLLVSLREEGVPRGLVTASQPKIMRAVLDGLDEALFDVTVCAGDVVRNKPHPDPYLTAARLLAVDPPRCTALEDSPNGVASAEAAGMTVVAVPSVVPIAPAPRRRVVSSLTEVDVAWLKSLHL
ncbi:HAD family hydrolase [Rhizohabitans arisaemae]|uniref:HAD family hydrolase n=1 Tax=Rhizohabitans arisaemae TaxID=2720610 RepID=UPI0024B045E1|nr:HAD family phosphatase [Rhizohabitans arisaemae]